MDRILISGCLVGQRVRYDGGAKTLSDDLLTLWHGQNRLVAFCPEVAAGLPTPRAKAEIEPDASAADVLAGRAQVLDETGADISAAFIKGAGLALKMAQKHRCRFAILTDKSPSCGSRQVYDGGFQGRLLAGQGITALVLANAGIRIFAQTELDQLAAELT